MATKQTLSDAEAAKKWRAQQEKAKDYWKRYQAEVKILRRKCADAGIVVTKAEVEAEIKKSA